MGKKYEIELPDTCPPDAIIRWQRAIKEMSSGYEEDHELNVVACMTEIMANVEFV